MTNTKWFVGVAALALVAGVAATAAAGPALHRMTVKTPDGGMAIVEYSGNVAPRVRFAVAPVPAQAFVPVDPFAGLERISLQMDREMSVLLHQADMLTMPFANPLYNATLLKTPPGASSYAVIETAAGHHMCLRSTEITQDKDGKSHIVSHSSGDCAATGLSAQPAGLLPPDGEGRLEPIGTAVPRMLPPSRQMREVNYQPK